MTPEEAARRKAQGKRLRMARVEFTLEEMAEKISERWARQDGFAVSRDFVRRVEKGERDAEVGYIIAVSEITGQPLSWLLGVEFDPDPVRAIPG